LVFDESSERFKMWKHSKKTDDVVEYVITAADPVKNLLLQIKDCLVLKKKQANLVLEILERKKKIKSKSDFLEVCQLTDKVAMLNYSKKRTITAKDVEKVLFPDVPDDAIL
jgi:hypothetical protein